MQNFITKVYGVMRIALPSAGITAFFGSMCSLNKIKTSKLVCIKTFSTHIYHTISYPSSRPDPGVVRYLKS